MELTAKDIRYIIKACRENMVESLKLGDLEVCFAKPIVETSHPPTPNRWETTIPEIEGKAIEFAPSRDQGEEDGKDMIDDLMVSDPAAFEEQLGQGEIVTDEETHDRGIE